jgi:dephospho-CoA kinase
MPIFGITGGIASGKSTFRKLLVERIQAVSFDADACVSRLLVEDESVRKQILENVHSSAYPAGKPDRALLRELIYNNPEMKRALEQILHPRVRAKWAKEAKEAALAGRPFVVDIPLLFETQAESHFDRIITVACSLETQLARLGARDGLNYEISKKIIASQMPIGIKISKSHHVIWNDGTLSVLSAQAELLSRYLHDRNG